MRGLKVATKVQYAIVMASVVKRAEKSVVRSPPPSFPDIAIGVRIRRGKRRDFEQLSPPEPAAGRGPFFIAGD